MHIHTGHSTKADAEAAVAEATGDFVPHDTPFSLVLAFTSTTQDASAVARALSARFPGVPLAGCTTAGESVGGEHFRGSLSVMGIASRQVRAAVTRVTNLAAFDVARAREAADRLLADLGLDSDTLDARKTFCLVFIDGLSCKEESVAALMAEALGGIPLVGGSAGDDLKFKETKVLADGVAESDAAVFVLVSSELPFEIIKHQHFVGTPTTIVITKADVAKRRVYEIDGYPAAEAYARALGMRREDVNADVAFLHPVTFACDGELYVRSIQKIEDDGSIVFYCAIEEGMVLDIAGHREMTAALEAGLAPLREKIGRAGVFIGFNCILRALEATGAGLHDALGARLRDVSASSICFDTYGEQLDGLHMNQTLVGVALARESA